MSRWFRLHEEILDDPKVQRLSGDDFKAWVNLLCLASRNGGKLPPEDDIAFALRLPKETVSTVLERLLNGGLIVRRSGGADGGHYAPHKWNERQYKSDTSTGRVKRFRERSKSVTETAPETETETETEKKEEVTGSDDPRPLGFDGKVIKLNELDFKRWQKSFPAIDLLAALQSRDDWLATEAGDEHRKKWFISTSNYLASVQGKSSKAAKDDRDRITV